MSATIVKAKKSESQVATSVASNESILKKRIADLESKLFEANAKIEGLVKISSPILTICKNKIPFEVLQKRILDAGSRAGRLSDEARKAGLGRIAKDMSGGGTLIPTLAVLSDMEALNLLGSTKAEAQAAKLQVISLNRIIDGLIGLGLAKRY